METIQPGGWPENLKMNPVLADSYRFVLVGRTNIPITIEGICRLEIDGQKNVTIYREEVSLAGIKEFIALEIKGEQWEQIWIENLSADRKNWYILSSLWKSEIRPTKE